MLFPTDQEQMLWVWIFIYKSALSSLLHILKNLMSVVERTQPLLWLVGRLSSWSGRFTCRTDHV